MSISKNDVATVAAQVKNLEDEIAMLQSDIDVANGHAFIAPWTRRRLAKKQELVYEASTNLKAAQRYLAELSIAVEF